MKHFFSIFILAILVLNFTSCGNNSKTGTNFTATSTGVGPIQLGLTAGEIPASENGLYDSFTIEVINDDFDGDYTILHFTLSGTPVANAYIYYEEKIASIEILGSNIASEEGISPGTKVQELFNKGAKAAMRNDGQFTLEINKIGYHVSGLNEAGDIKLTNGYLTGETPQITIEDFESDAEVTSFFIF